MQAWLFSAGHSFTVIDPQADIATGGIPVRMFKQKRNTINIDFF